jgi:putative FmdB family regulatory protein
VPTYQYQCADCGEALEVRQSFTDDALTVCPSCDGSLRKVFNAVGVVFKGSGFYRNDSRSSVSSSSPADSSSKPDSKSSESKSPSSDGASKSSSDSKTSAKSSDSKSTAA